MIQYTLSLLDPRDATDLRRELAREFFGDSIAARENERVTVVPPSKPVARIDIVSGRNPKDPR